MSSSTCALWLSLAAWSLTGGPWSVQLHLQDEHPDICVQTGGQTPQCVSTLLRHLAVALPRWA
ncbi:MULTISPECIES: hypothetical protein [Stenotrophomonas]|jgi:hypothetical protein|uniref:Uncharacterized protein n=1 Tax=Stenotrophomonas maltophilia TaxID=40324 RepID=A0A4S2D9K0_STEMA|nr:MULTISPECIES: hypothetical protein [Stenotrophomonas]MBD3827595.1 hypothetical protein [Stenotrophomonas sp.]TGY37343.1 hypothetical protein E5352_01925 [Stenotrophomonas maltophilia]